MNNYIDADFSYLLGLIIARGIIEDGATKQLIIEFPYSSLKVEGINSSFDQDKEIKLGLSDVRERLLELLDTDIKIVHKQNSIDFIVRFMRSNMAWRNLLSILGNLTSYSHFEIPPIFFTEQIPFELKREFVRGFADVAGNIRHANRYVDNRHRVRLDVLNYPTNWFLPVQICRLLQEHLNTPVQLITWGHPNLGRGFREHQINIFAKPFLKLGFSFPHKQTILEEFIEYDENLNKVVENSFCPGKKKLRNKKPYHPDENNAEKLDQQLCGNHYDAYWQICKSLGCNRVPDTKDQELLNLDIE